MLTSPIREPPVVLGCTVYAADPEAVPLPLTLIQDCVVVAVQRQPLAVATVTVPAAPAPVNVRVAGMSV